MTMTIILLAAGLSNRMGSNKLLLPYKGRTIIENTLLSLLPFGDRIIVVTGFERKKIEETLSIYKVDFIFNKNYLQGQRESTLTGLRAIADDDFAIVPSDLPLIEKDDIVSLLDALKSAPIVRPVFKTIPGHPVFYKKENREKLLAFPGSMKDYLKNIGYKSVPSSLGTIYDCDTPKRYEGLLLSNGNMSILDSYID